MHSKNELIRLYKKETNLKVKERLLLVIKVRHDNVIPAYAADELHRSRPWALYWLDRFSEEGVDGLKNRPKSGRHPDIPEENSIRDKKRISIQQTGMDYKTGRRSNSQKKWWNQISLYPHLQTNAQMGIQTESTSKEYM